MIKALSLFFSLSILYPQQLKASEATLPFSSTSRQNYIEKEILALRKISKKELKKIVEALDFSEKQKCRSLFEALTLRCLQKEAIIYCQKSDQTCNLLWDVAIVNKINEKVFVTKDELFKISQSTSNFPVAFAKALNAKHALLATELLFSTKKFCAEDDTACVAAKIDGFCLKNADLQGMPWQACSAALTWFLGDGY